MKPGGLCFERKSEAFPRFFECVVRVLAQGNGFTGSPFSRSIRGSTHRKNQPAKQNTGALSHACVFIFYLRKRLAPEGHGETISTSKERSFPLWRRSASRGLTKPPEHPQATVPFLSCTQTKHRRSFPRLCFLYSAVKRLSPEGGSGGHPFQHQEEVSQNGYASCLTVVNSPNSSKPS